MTIKSRRGVLAPTPKAAPKRTRRAPIVIPATLSGLNTQEAIFVAEYLVDLDAQRAALAAGYSPSMAKTKCYLWVSDGKLKPHVYDAVQRAVARKLTKLEVTQDAVVQGLARLGFSNIMDYGRVDSEGQFAIDLSSTTREEASALQSVKVKRTVRTIGDVDIEETTTELRLAPKREAIVDLGRHLGMFKDEGGPIIPVTFNINYGDRPAPPRLIQALEEDARR